MKKTLVSWSSGKDSAWMVHVLRQQPDVQLAGLLTGAVVTEQVFSRPGLGRVAITAIGNRDFPLIQGTVLVTAIVYVLVNLAVDLSYAVIDPRIRYE
mgnify:CR=1 FL=1